MHYVGERVLFTPDDWTLQEMLQFHSKFGLGLNINTFDKSPLPATIVRLWGPNCANLKIHTDGALDYWVTSVAEGTGERQFQSLIPC